MECAPSIPAAIALLVVSGLVVPHAGPDPFGHKLNALRAELALQRAELARWAFDHDLFREAGYLARAVLEHKPDHAIGELEAELKRLDQADFTRRYRNAVRRYAEKFKGRLSYMSKPMAKKLVALAKDADKAGNSEVAEDCFLLANRIDGSNKDASRALHKRDYDVIFNYGAVPKTEKEAARKILERLGGNFLREKDLRRELDTWTDAWGLSTRHYRFVTNAPHMTVFQFAQSCEELYDAWEQIMRESKIKVRELRKPACVWFFDSSITFQAILRTLDREPPDGALGFYSHETGVGYFYNDPAFYKGNLLRLKETFWHEGTHQLLHQRVKSPDKGNIAKYPLPWIEEGFCLYMELLQIQGEGDKRRFTFGGVVDDDLAGGLFASLEGKLLDLEQFVHMSDTAWDKYEHAYAHSALLMHYLLEGDGRRYRELAFSLLERDITQGGLRKQTLFEALGVKPAELEAACSAHATRIIEQLPFREYEAKDK